MTLKRACFLSSLFLIVASTLQGCATAGKDHPVFFGTLNSAPVSVTELAKAGPKTPSNLKAIRQDMPVGSSQAVPGLWPVEDTSRTIISPFGSRGSHGSYDHKGLDIKAPEQTPVLATADGTVKFSGSERGYGNVVVLDHGQSVESRYGHLAMRKVEEGQHVHCGDVIGLLGASGNASTPHVHYEVRMGGKPQDPTFFLPAGGTKVMTAMASADSGGDNIPDVLNK